MSTEQDRYEVFDEFFSNRPADSKAGIVLQHTPDPDAIGSALGLQWLLEVRYGIQSDIFYSGQVSHPQNQTAINVLDARLKHKSEFLEEDESGARLGDEYNLYITVDAVPQNTGFDEIDVWDAVFDHHKFEMDLPVTDIRSTGACCSIIWDYLNHFDVDFDTETGVIVATALLFGIANDTHQLLTENVCELDLRAHSDLIQYIDRKKYQNIVNYPLPPYLFDLRARAAENMVNEASILISYLGILTEKRRDALPIIADEFLRMEGVETVVVFCMIEGEVHVSMRSQNSSVNVHNFCQKVFGSEYAGGKQGAGGARAPIGLLYSPEDDDKLEEELSDFARETLTSRMIRVLSGA